MHRWLAILLAPFLGSCGWHQRQPVAPLPIDTAPAAIAPATETLVLLPGRLEGPQAFRKRGVFEQVAELRPKARIVAPDLHDGYYLKRTAVARLREDVVAPARARGDRVTLAGVSMGGLGALTYALEHPGDIDEILLFAPYVGERRIVDEIRAAGGLGNWAPPAPADDDFQRRLWLGIRDQWVKKSAGPRIRLMVGSRDFLLPGSRLLRDELLAPDDYFELDGGHNWKVWREGFRLLLPSN